jgi:hypothetical protein
MIIYLGRERRGDLFYRFPLIPVKWLTDLTGREDGKGKAPAACAAEKNKSSAFSVSSARE